MEFMARLRKISSEQWELWLEDNVHVMQALQNQRSMLGWFGTALSHVNRRAQHQQEGSLAF